MTNPAPPRRQTPTRLGSFGGGWVDVELDLDAGQALAVGTQMADELDVEAIEPGPEI